MKPKRHSSKIVACAVMLLMLFTSISCTQEEATEKKVTEKKVTAEEARAIACRLPANPLLEARLATAEGRHLDAIETLEHAGESPDVVCLLLQRLAKTGRYRRLRRHLGGVDVARTAAADEKPRGTM